MSSPSADHREVRLRLEDGSAHTTTTLTLAVSRRALDLATDFDDVAVDADGVRDCRLERGVVRLRGVRSGATVVVSGRVSYRSAPHGLCRWTDPADGREYVVASGALGGASHFLAYAEGPADRMATRVLVEAPGTVRAGGGPDRLAGHHLGLVAGPWRVLADRGTELLTRQSLEPAENAAGLLADTREVLAWMLDWFGATVEGGPWGSTYTQVLLPRASWLAMEHPGCVLLSERLLTAPRARRVAVLAHEAAHQWIGNRVSPRTWADVGLFEGLAELLGQLACEALVGPDSGAYLARRRAHGPLALPSTGPDLRTLACTAGLAEVAGPVQHAELLRGVLAEVGVTGFRARLRDLVDRRGDTACSAAEVWEALGCPPREPEIMRLPTLTDGRGRARWPQLDALDLQDPNAAAAAARHAFRACSPGPRRVRAALTAMADPATPHPVVAGIAAELGRGRMH